MRWRRGLCPMAARWWLAALVAIPSAPAEPGQPVVFNILPDGKHRTPVSPAVRVAEAHRTLSGGLVVAAPPSSSAQAVTHVVPSRVEFEDTSQSATISFEDLAASATISFEDRTASATIAFEDVPAQNANIAAGGGLDDQVASTTLVLATAIADLDAGEYIKSANNEYMRVSALSIDKKTLTVTRAASPPGLVAGPIAEAADGSSIILAEGGVDATGTTVKLVAPLLGLATGEYIKSAAGEYMLVTNLENSDKTLTVERNGAPAGLTQKPAASAAAGTSVTLADGGVDATGTTVKLVAPLSGLTVGAYIKSASGEYMKVIAIADSGHTLRIVRNAAPEGLVQTQRGRSPTAPAGTVVTLASGGVDNSTTIVKLVAPMAGLDVGEYIKSDGGEYMLVTAISDSGKKLAVMRHTAPLGLRSNGPTPAAAGSIVTLTQAVIPQYFSACSLRSHSSPDMEICHSCCTNICETGSDLPQMGGEDVLPAFRAEVCDKVCTTHCGYGRAISSEL